MSGVESFIPLRRSDLVKLCLTETQLAPNEAKEFAELAELLTAFLHFRSLRDMEALKDSYAPFNPDADHLVVPPALPRGSTATPESVAHGIEELLLQANYRKITIEELKQAFEEESLIPLKTHVDFDDYGKVLFYYRGFGRKTALVRRFLRRREIEVDNYDRVVLLLEFRDAEWFARKARKAERREFMPGKIYMYLYKNVPRYDMELLFPNVRVSMNWKDRVMLLGPALGGAIPLLAKALPSLGLIAGAAALYLLGPGAATRFRVDASATQALYPVLAALLSLAMVLGGFAMRQYLRYKSKRLEFLKKVSDTLFFRNLVTNAAVITALKDAADEELGKEAILVLYHLFVARSPVSETELDARIEGWLRRHAGIGVDFDIAKTLEQLRQLGECGDKGPLVRRDDAGRVQACSLSEAKILLDACWDDAFRYAGAG
jgi:hypothetical protein